MAKTNTQKLRNDMDAQELSLQERLANRKKENLSKSVDLVVES